MEDFYGIWGSKVDRGGKWSIVAPLGVTQVLYEVKVRGGTHVSWYPISAT
jgi:hypothetical protein